MAKKLIFKFGSMGASKTANLLMTNHNYVTQGFKTLILKPKLDTRDDKVTSRIGIEHPCVAFSEDMDLYAYIDKESKEEKVHAVFIDECQFCTYEQIEQLARVVDYLEVYVFCYGLRTDFQSKLFAGSQRLFELADKVEQLPSVCDCGSKSIMNQRLQDGKPVYVGEQIDCGAEDKYITKCRKCYFEDMVAASK